MLKILSALDSLTFPQLFSTLCTGYRIHSTQCVACLKPRKAHLFPISCKTDQLRRARSKLDTRKQVAHQFEEDAIVNEG